MATKPKQEEQSKEDILKELYKDNASNESDEDLDLGIDKLKVVEKPEGK